MATIINTLEVVLEQPQRPTQPGTAAPTSASPPRAIAPQDVSDILDRERRYAARLLAH